MSGQLLDTVPVTTPTLLALEQGPAWLFCTATVGYDSICKAGLRPDGTCPNGLRHRHRAWEEYAPLRFEAPPVIYREPLCPLCEEPVMHDGDGWYCEDCRFTWPTSTNDPGESSEVGKYQCTATTQGGRVRCVLTDEEESPRSHEIRRRYMRWTGKAYVWDEVVTRWHRGVPVGADGHPDPYRGLWDDDGVRWEC